MLRVAYVLNLNLVENLNVGTYLRKNHCDHFMTQKSLTIKDEMKTNTILAKKTLKYVAFTLAEEISACSKDRRRILS